MATTVPCTDVAESERFYCEDTGYFRRTDLYGEGWSMLELAVEGPPASRPRIMLLSSVEAHRQDCVLFFVHVADVEEEFRRLTAVARDQGRELVTGELFEYPLATFFVVEDPSANTIQVEENRGLPRADPSADR